MNELEIHMGCYHISPTEKGWELRKEGATRPSKTASEKAVLLESIESFMQNRAGTVKVHGEDGSVEQELRYPPARRYYDSSGD
ncbi:hypothetical protein TUM18999_30590 [Pseudomonas tohonis]|uniref:DUF2188 domain-containing protein n=2 Tax=Pseudomonas tohonis TaxID=2725477 RepID=A0A6J4E607_9PSED|nr:hypothetical protein TUM18999_30590 [Pseudomonas tohonis]GJN53891.1 hypothetical protein TUM20286_36430 [Pseudomonas tohonis]